MGRPSNRLHSAQRPGKRERARVKKHRRGSSWHSVTGAGTCTLKAGRKKTREFYRSRKNPFGLSHLGGDSPKLKAGTQMLDGQSTGKSVQFRPDGIEW